ncbi:MAG: hypothetical protein NUW23_10805, partial [Firmicutes bacterium]|nr:hypothetical protein [Bacillota bacterium]
AARSILRLGRSHWALTSAVAGRPGGCRPLARAERHPVIHLVRYVLEPAGDRREERVPDIQAKSLLPTRGRTGQNVVG